MRGLARRLTLCALGCVLSLALGCAAKQPNKAEPSTGVYAMPETTNVKLGAPCKMNKEGTKFVEKCRFLVTPNTLHVVKQ